SAAGGECRSLSSLEIAAASHDSLLTAGTTEPPGRGEGECVSPRGGRTHQTDYPDRMARCARRSDDTRRALRCCFWPRGGGIGFRSCCLTSFDRQRLSPSTRERVHRMNLGSRAATPPVDGGGGQAARWSQPASPPVY